MTFDSLTELRAAGNPVDTLSPEQQEVLRNLTPAEVTTRNSVKARIDDVSDVEGHDTKGFGIF